MSNTLRPGVFSSYSVSSAYAPRAGGYGIAVCGCFGLDSAPQKCTAVPYSVPAGSAALTGAAQALFAAGVSEFWCVSPAQDTAAAYTDALTALAAREVYCIVCESAAQETLAAAADFAAGQADLQKERMLFACATDATAAASAAAAINSERVVLVCPGDGGSVLPAACAVAAAVALSEDPAVSFSGVELPGLSACGTLSDSQIETLLAAGVTPLEQIGDAVCCVRLLTTRTATAGTADRTFAPVNTILIIDYVLRSLRETLRLLLRGAKNNAATLSAVSSQVAVLLGTMLENGIITAYGAPNVYCPANDPETCIVAVSFSAACVINQIHIQAHIQL